MFPMKPLLQATLILSLANIAAASAASAQSPARIEVQPLANETALAAQDVAVLDSLVLSAMSELPQAELEVVAVKEVIGPGCDNTCRIFAARSRGASRAVIGRVAMFGQGFVGTLELYDVATGQLLESATTDVANDAAALLAAMKEAAAQLRRRIAPDPVPQPAPPSPPPTATAAPAPPLAPQAVTATLRVETTPPGAEVFIKRLGQSNSAGRSPVEKVLLPVEYRVIATMKEHRTAVEDVRLDPLTTKTLHLTLQRIYPMSPYKVWGHAAFWPGLAVTAFGFSAMAVSREAAAAYRQDLDKERMRGSRIWAGLMWAGFGLGAALTTTGVVLWAATPSSKERWEKEHGQLAIAPTPDGGFFAAYGRRF
jgi:hypothetical protein